MTEQPDLRAMYAEGQLTIDVETAAVALGLSRGLAYDAARHGQLPGCLKVGGRYVVSIPGLLRVLEAVEDDENPQAEEMPLEDATGPLPLTLERHRIYRPSEIVRVCHVPRDYLYAALESGELPAVRRSRGYLISGSRVMEWLERFGDDPPPGD